MIDVKNAVLRFAGFPKNEIEDLQRCLATLYSVRAGEQPLNRDFGIDSSFLDLPVNLAGNTLALEIIEKTRRYEPRAAVEKVEYEAENDGWLIPVVYLRKGGTE